jgi:hypothetical protein
VWVSQSHFCHEIHPDTYTTELSAQWYNLHFGGFLLLLLLLLLKFHNGPRIYVPGSTPRNAPAAAAPGCCVLCACADMEHGWTESVARARASRPAAAAAAPACRGRELLVPGSDSSSAAPDYPRGCPPCVPPRCLPLLCQYSSPVENGKTQKAVGHIPHDLRFSPILSVVRAGGAAQGGAEEARPGHRREEGAARGEAGRGRRGQGSSARPGARPRRASTYSAANGSGRPSPGASAGATTLQEAQGYRHAR